MFCGRSAYERHPSPTSASLCSYVGGLLNEALSQQTSWFEYASFPKCTLLCVVVRFGSFSSCQRIKVRCGKVFSPEVISQNQSLVRQPDMILRNGCLAHCVLGMSERRSRCSLLHPSLPKP